MLERNSYNIGEKFDYDTVKTIVSNSLEKYSKRRGIKEEG